MLNKNENLSTQIIPYEIVNINNKKKIHSLNLNNSDIFLFLFSANQEKKKENELI